MTAQLKYCPLKKAISVLYTTRPGHKPESMFCDMENCEWWNESHIFVNDDGRTDWWNEDGRNDTAPGHCRIGLGR